MTLSFVNQRTIHGIVYTALRDNEDPKLQFIEREDGDQKSCRLRDVWNSDSKIEALWQS